MGDFRPLVLSLTLVVTVIGPIRAEGNKPIKLGKCNPTGAAKTLNTALSKGKDLEQAFALVLKNKQFDGSKACITFIRETTMQARDTYPYAFRKLWQE